MRRKGKTIVKIGRLLNLKRECRSCHVLNMKAKQRGTTKKEAVIFVVKIDSPGSKFLANNHGQ